MSNLVQTYLNTVCDLLRRSQYVQKHHAEIFKCLGKGIWLIELDDIAHSNSIYTGNPIYMPLDCISMISDEENSQLVTECNKVTSEIAFGVIVHEFSKMDIKCTDCKIISTNDRYVEYTFTDAIPIKSE